MLQSLRSLRALGLALLGIPLALCGCGQPVREDRSVSWTPQGQAVGFQHEGEGIFVADKNGGSLKNIFTPDPEVLATSTPLWAPDGRRALFTTARDPSGNAGPGWPIPDLADPAGAVHRQRPITYTCWLYEGGNDKPKPLFEAACDHVGYVAANLAVRWHPREDCILYVKQIQGPSHGLFAHDLLAKTSRQVMPHTAGGLVFDWTPDGRHLVCVLGSGDQPQPKDGIWIGQPEQDDWWHVPSSGDLAWAELPSLLERLRATRPAWTPDGTRFAFATFTPSRTQGAPRRAAVHRCTLATRRVETIAEGSEPYRDLHWARDGAQLGLVRGGELGSLQILRDGKPPRNETENVRRFVGWNKAGDRLACIVHEKVPLAERELWSFLLVPDPLARDAVHVVAKGVAPPRRPVFSGMRVTFPQWSPAEDKLSLWFTFTPVWRSWLALLLGQGLRPGDPAAIFDVPTGTIGWMAVNPFEKAQIGHYHLLRREYTEAERRYAEAERALPRPRATDSVRDALRQATGPRSFAFFHAYCLSKLSRMDEARKKRAQFEASFLPRPAPGEAQPESTDPFESWLREMLSPPSALAPLVRDLYEAEVFLSLDAAADGEAFFREELRTVPTDAARLSAALVLGQILLIEGKHVDYATVTTETVAPLLARLTRPAAGPGAANPLDPRRILDMVGALALVPLAAPDFLAGLPDLQLRKMAPAWEAIRREAATEGCRYASVLVLHGLYQRLQMPQKEQEVAQQRQALPATGMLPAGDVKQGIESLRKEVRALFQGR